MPSPAINYQRYCFLSSLTHAITSWQLSCTSFMAANCCWCFPCMSSIHGSQLLLMLPMYVLDTYIAFGRTSKKALCPTILQCWVFIHWNGNKFNQTVPWFLLALLTWLSSVISWNATGFAKHFRYPFECVCALCHRPSAHVPLSCSFLPSTSLLFLSSLGHLSERHWHGECDLGRLI